MRQDFRDSVRFVMFETGFEGWEYATHGGTLFVASLNGKPFGITCRHVLGDFDWRQLAITEAKFGQHFAGLKGIFYPSSPQGAAIGSDVLDIAVVQFADDVGPDFFTDPPYIIDDNTCCTSSDGDAPLVNGALKEESDLTGPAIAPVFALLELEDRGTASFDQSLREAGTQFKQPEFNSIIGLSGSPVFNVTRTALCGVVVRGGLSGDQCTMWYVDIFDIRKLLIAIIESRSDTEYKKVVTRPVTRRR